MEREPFRLEVDTADLLLWRVVHLSVHRYDNPPTGELLTVLVIKFLDEIGYQPTLSELAALVGLPKSTVSRYVSSLMSDGFLEEYIDRADRRRRRLRCTAAAEAERDWHLSQVLSIRDRTGSDASLAILGRSTVPDMVELLRGFGREAPLRFVDGRPEAPPAARRPRVPASRPDPETGLIYAILWCFIDHSVHRFGSTPSAEMLVALSMILLDMVHYYPTTAELGEMIGLRKPMVSRYCSAHITAGYLEEFVDTEDRRLRRLRLSNFSRGERGEHRRQMAEIKEHAMQTLAGLRPLSEYDTAEILELMREFVTGTRPPRLVLD